MKARWAYGPLSLLVLTSTPAIAAEGSEVPRIANFAIVAIALFLAIRKPLGAYLSARTEQIQMSLEDARDKVARAKKEQEQAGALLQSIAKEVEKAKEEAKRAAEAERIRILEVARIEGERIRETVRKEIESELEAGRRKLLGKAAELTVSLAKEKLEKTMTSDDQKRLIDKSVELLGKKV